MALNLNELLEQEEARKRSVVSLPAVSPTGARLKFIPPGETPGVAEVVDNSGEAVGTKKPDRGKPIINEPIKPYVNPRDFPRHGKPKPEPPPAVEPEAAPEDNLTAEQADSPVEIVDVATVRGDGSVVGAKTHTRKGNEPVDSKVEAVSNKIIAAEALGTNSAPVVQGGVDAAVNDLVRAGERGVVDAADTKMVNEEPTVNEVAVDVNTVTQLASDGNVASNDSLPIEPLTPTREVIAEVADQTPKSPDKSEDLSGMAMPTTENSIEKPTPEAVPVKPVEAAAQVQEVLPAVNSTEQEAPAMPAEAEQPVPVAKPILELVDSPAMELAGPIDTGNPDVQAQEMEEPAEKTGIFARAARMFGGGSKKGKTAGAQHLIREMQNGSSNSAAASNAEHMFRDQHSVNAAAEEQPAREELDAAA